eukprot:COSAG01_NODE_1709_length_9424_cov_50.603968_7_plen_334_part_00
MLTKCKILTLVSDGWSGVQKKHVLNILLCTPIPFFIRDIYTGEASVDGTYQFEQFSKVIEERNRDVNGFWFVRALCTDNASVMKKTWRLLRGKFPGLLTLGCAPHALNLHAQKLMRLPRFKSLILSVNIIVTWFRNHHGAGGLATLHAVQSASGKQPKNMVKANKTRWNAMIDSVRSAVDIKADLVGVVTHSTNWNWSGPAASGAQVVRDMVLQNGIHSEFWTNCVDFVAFTRAIRLATLVLQSYNAKASDVYACYVAIHSAIEASAIDATMKNEARDICFARLNFIFHPVMLVAYVLDPRYAKASNVPSATAKKWLKILAKALLTGPSGACR